MVRNASMGFAVLVGALALGLSATAWAGIHTWDINEVFSNADGTIQFVELFDAGAGGTETGVGTGIISSTTPGQSFALSGGPVVGPTNGKFYLIATQAFADLPGAPVPDDIIPPGSIPFFNIAGDTVAYASDSWGFGAVPTNGSDSLDRFTGVGANSPTNYAGATGSVSVAIPVLSLPALLGLATLLIATGAAAIWRRQRIVSRSA